jgi:homoserine kinase
VSQVADWLHQPVSVRVPATSANLGPGFDALGLALNVHDMVRAEVACTCRSAARASTLSASARTT